jgi:hypothetical protein
LIANDLCRDHRDSLTLSRVYLSRHNAAPWLILGQAELPKSAPGAGTKIPNVIGYFHERASDHVESSVRFYEGIMGGKSFKLGSGQLNT